MAHSNLPPTTGRLLKVLGMWFGVAAAFGNTIGAGIVRTPGDVARLLPNAWIFLGVWILGGLYALSGASSMAELGAAIPRSGGQYNFSRRALGDYPILAGNTKMEIISIAIICGFGVLQWRGIKWGSGTQLASATIKAGAFLILVIACFLLGGPAHKAAIESGASSLSMPTGWSLVIAVMLGLQAVIYTVDGWDGIIYFGEEVRNPGRDIPRAIFGSVFSIMGIYLLLNLVALYILPMKEIAGNNFALGSVASRVFGSLGDPIIRSIMVVSMLSCMNANQLFCTRTLYTMSCDGLFFRRATHVNAGGTPTISLLLSTIVGVLFVLISFLNANAFEHVIDMLSFFFVANYTLSYSSLFILRRREPEMNRPYKAWGYPWTTGIALVASVLFLMGSLLPDFLDAVRAGKYWPPSPAMLALIALLLSYPVFRILKSVSQRGDGDAANNS
jgi:APA family basic amino acid/polyamine antiporter